MRLLDVRGALGGPWATSATCWLILFGPVVLLVLLQETSVGFDNAGLVLVSAIVQHVCAGLVVLLVAGSVRRGRDVLPLWASLLAWSAGGVMRGVAGGVVAATVTDADPDFAFRIAAWLAIAWVWMPLLVYLLAQLDHRRKLLPALSSSENRRDEARGRAARSRDEIRDHLIAAVVGTVGPVVNEIRLSLRAAAGTISDRQMQAISERLSQVSSETARSIERLSLPPAPSGDAPPPRRLPLVPVLDFERRRPLVSGILTGLALIALFAPATLRLGHIPLSVAAVTALVGSAMALALGHLLIKSGPDESMQDQLRRAVGRYGLSAATGCMVLASFALTHASSFAGVLTALLPFSLLFSSATVWAVVGAAEANRASFESLIAVEEEARQWDEAAAAEENAIRSQLSVLMHGPVQGRLAACAMALNFHAAGAGSASGETTEFITNAVLEHLDAASSDLDALLTDSVDVR